MLPAAHQAIPTSPWCAPTAAVAAVTRSAHGLVFFLDVVGASDGISYVVGECDGIFFCFPVIVNILKNTVNIVQHSELCTLYVTTL